MEGSLKNFGAVDVFVLVGLLLLYTLIGIYFAFKDRKKSSTQNYFFGNRKLNPVTVGLSFCVTYLSALAVIAMPAEIYIVGNSYLASPLVSIAASLLAVVYFIPTYMRLEIATLYEYLELRFNATTRRLSAALVTVNMVVYVGMNIYLSSLAISAVTPLSFDISVTICTIVCIFYTAVGGMKTVVWTDTLQAIIMIAGMASVLFKTQSLLGGFENVAKALERGDRTGFTKPDFDIRSRTSPLSISVSNLFQFCFMMHFSQPIVQRYQSCRNVRTARCAMAIYVVPALVIMYLSLGCGFAMYAYFERCDPVKSGKLESLDQAMPYLAMEVFSDVQGMAGLFVAAIVSASLSTISSAINSLSVMFVSDFVAIKWTNLSDRAKLIIGKIAVAVIGGVVMVFAYILPLFRSNVARILITTTGLINGPLMGLFLLGFFFPWANSMGSMIGAIVSFALTFWAMVGSMFWKHVPPHAPLPPVSTEFCAESQPNATANTSSIIPTESALYNVTTNGEEFDERYTFDQMVYSISFLNYMPIATSLTVVVGLLASFATGRNKPSETDPRLFIPLVDSQIFPARVRKFFRFGVPELQEKIDGLLNDRRTPDTRMSDSKA